MKAFQKIAIANRGEIAVRIIQAVKEMGLQSILLHSAEDQQSLAYRLADETLCIGPSAIKDSYLNIPHIIEALKSSQSCAIHPGVGFLSESFELAEACSKIGVVFIGPSTEQLQLFGHKIEALKYVHSLNAPTLPFYHIQETDHKEIIFTQAKKMGFPLMVKSVYGGGGMGIQKVDKEESLLESIQSVQNISHHLFHSKDVFLEKYVTNGQHIEVQIFGDHIGGIHHLFERNCSIQRRNQKIIEETPSFLPKEIKESIYQTATRIGKSIQYKGAGTVEFLVKNNEFYFIEMNTRLQVEHPITEMLLGVDLVQAQILNAMKRPPFSNYHFQPRGHSLECRVYSEDPKNHIPVSGTLGTVHWQHTSHCRFDVGYESKDTIPSFYDSLIGKVIVWGEKRIHAIQKMKYILNNSFIFGVPTNIPELLSIINSPQFIENKITTQFLKTPLRFIHHSLSQEEQKAIEKHTSTIEKASIGRTNNDPLNPWFHHWEV